MKQKHYQPKTDATGKPPSGGSNVKPAPKQLGERIPNTDLVRQWQGGREVYPRYISPRPNATLPQMCDEAFAQALAAGFKGVWVEGDCYILRGGEWYLWSLPHKG